MLLRFFRNIWPRLTWLRRAPVSRATYLQAEDGSILTAETGEVLVRE